MALRTLSSLLRRLAGRPAQEPTTPEPAPAAPAPPSRFLQATRRLPPPGYRLLFAWRGQDLIVLLASEAAPQLSRLSGKSLEQLTPAILNGDFSRLLVRRLRPDGRLTRLADCSQLLDLARSDAGGLRQWAARLGPPPPARLGRGEALSEAYLGYLRTLRSDVELIDFLYDGFASVDDALEGGRNRHPPPFDEPASLPRTVPAEPKRRSVLFLHNAFYHYNHLAAGLRRRGWDAMTVSLESPDSPHQQFFHGEDLNLFHPDPEIMKRQTRAFFSSVPERFGALHFYTKGLPTFFPENGDRYEDASRSERIVTLPWDMMELRRHRVIIGYMAAGSMDGARQSSIRKISRGLCEHCVWETRPDICNDIDNYLWAQRLEAMCDWIGLENDWATEERISDQYVRYPVITAMDSDMWRPDLIPPEEMRVVRQPGEILVYHAVGNYATRRLGRRDLKGTGAVMAAVERLKAEGVPVRLIFATNVPSRVVRFLQVQADIVIDQLNYGRMGANARESMMLGKPLIVKMDPRQTAPLPELNYIAEAPVVNANEDTVYEALKSLIQQPERREELGREARAFALKWHSSDTAAERFEDVCDRVARGLPPENPAVAAHSDKRYWFDPEAAEAG
jgi:hypothetical protein